MTYDEMISYIEGVSRFGICLGLGRIKELLKRLSNPEKNLPVIHVAGTNGKGSFCTFISQILMEAGYKVGRYISPTLYDYREKLQINHRWIEKEAAAALMTKIRDVCRDMEKDGFEHPTLFEIETAMAFLYFQQEKCDFVVLEVGMGGLEDSTNVITCPILSVITSISLDHTAILGETLEAIAVQKAGIIKENCPVLVYEQNDRAMAVIKSQALQKNAAVSVTDWRSLCVKSTGLTGQCFDYKDYTNLQICMAGMYQMYNASAAVDAAKQLRALGIFITRDAIYEGLRKAQWHGRFEVLSVNPYVIVDGAHNEDGAKALAHSIETYFKGKKLIGLMGVFADKDYETILKLMMPHLKILYTHKPHGDRGLESSALKRVAEYTGDNVKIVDAGTVIKAYEQARRSATPEDVILSFGSLSTIGELSSYIKKGETDGR